MYVCIVFFFFVMYFMMLFNCIREHFKFMPIFCLENTSIEFIYEMKHYENKSKRFYYLKQMNKNAVSVERWPLMQL